MEPRWFLRPPPSSDRPGAWPPHFEPPPPPPVVVAVFQPRSYQKTKKNFIFKQAVKEERMKRLRFSKEDLRQLDCLKSKAHQLTRMVENDYMYLQINSASISIMKGMLTEIKLASEKITEASNFHLPEVQTDMKTYNTKVSIFFTEIEWIFQIFQRSEIEQVILRNSIQESDEINIY